MFRIVVCHEGIEHCHAGLVEMCTVYTACDTEESNNSGLKSDSSDSLASHLTSFVFVNVSDSLDQNLSLSNW